jgi:hypothetical protein
MIDMLSNNELSNTAYKDDLRANTNTFEIGTTTISVPLNVVQLGDTETLTGNVILNNFKIAKHYLSQQELLTRSYVSRRDNFYKVVIANNDKKQTRTFLDKATHIQLKRDFHRFPNQEPTRFFKQLFDETFKSHYRMRFWPLPHTTPRLTTLSDLQWAFVFYIFTTSIALVCALRFRVFIRLPFRP